MFCRHFSNLQHKEKNLFKLPACCDLLIWFVKEKQFWKSVSNICFRICKILWGKIQILAVQFWPRFFSLLLAAWKNQGKKVHSVRIVGKSCRILAVARYILYFLTAELLLWKSAIHSFCKCRTVVGSCSIVSKNRICLEICQNSRKFEILVSTQCPKKTVGTVGNFWLLLSMSKRFTGLTPLDVSLESLVK